MYKILCDENVLHDGRFDDYQIIDPKLSLELNKTGLLSFSIDPSHPMYTAIEKFNSEIEVYNDDDLIFAGRAFDNSMDFDKTLRYECEGELAYLIDTIQRPTVYQNITVADYVAVIIGLHNAQVEERKQFTVGSITVTDPNDSLYRFSNYETTWETVNDKLIDRLGGYIRTRHVDGVKYIDYVETPGNISTQTIRFGENLLDFVKHTQGADVATAIIPLGIRDAETDVRLTIASVNGGLDYVYDADAVALYGWIFRTVEYDDVTLPENLMTRGYSELAVQKLLNITLELSAVDLSMLGVEVDSIKLGDSIRVISEPHNVDEWMIISKLDIDIEDAAKTKITLGSTRRSLTDETTDRLNGIVEKVTKIESDYVIGDQIRDVKNDVLSLDSKITQTAENIRIDVDRDFVSKGNFDIYQESVSSSFTQTAADITLAFNKVQGNVNTVDGKVDANQLMLETYIRFDEDGIELGKSGSPFISKLSNTELAFLQNGQKVAYISNNKLYITDAEVNNKLTIGKPSNGYFDFIPRDNGNLSFKFRSID